MYIDPTNGDTALIERDLSLDRHVTLSNFLGSPASSEAQIVIDNPPYAIFDLPQIQRDCDSL